MYHLIRMWGDFTAMPTIMLSPHNLQLFYLWASHAGHYSI